MLSWKDCETLGEVRCLRCQAVVKSVRALEEMVFIDSAAKQIVYCQLLLGSCCISSTFGERQAKKPGLDKEISPDLPQSLLQQ